VANYDVDIEIALRGADKLRGLQADLKSVTREVGRVNAATIKLGRGLEKNFSRRSIENVNNYSNAVRRAERALRNAAAGTDAEKKAVSALVTAQKEYNAQIDRQNKLLEEERRIQGVPTSRRPSTSPAAGSNQVSIRSPLASPVFGARNIAGSPMAKAFGFEQGGGGGKKGVTMKDRIESAVSAGAFPLLFGGGPGMAAGGAIGGFAAGQTFGPAAIALQVLGGAIDDAAEKQKQLGLALKEGKGVVTAYEAAVVRLSSAKKEYLNNLEQSGQKQKLFEETVKQAEEDLGFFGKILIANAQNAGKFDRGLQQLTSTLKGLAVAAATPAFLQATPEAPQKNQQDALTQAAKDRVNAVREEAATVGLTLQTKQKQFALENKLNEANIESVAAAQTAEIVEERRVAIAQARSDKLKGLITESERDEKITIATKEAEVKLLDVERQRLANAERLRQKKEQIARDSMRAAAENARADADRRKKEEEAFMLSEKLRAQLNMQSVDEAVKRTALIHGEEAGLQRALDMSERRFGAEKQLLAIENTALRSKLLGLRSEEEINAIVTTRIELLNRNNQIRNAELQNALNQLKIEKELSALRAGQETAGISTGLGRSIEDAQFRLANPFGTDDNEMLELRIKQVRRLEDARTSLNDQIDQQNILLEKGTPKQKEQASIQIRNLQKRLKLYNELLPQLDAVEQAELRQQQILEKVQPVADAVAQGIVNIFRSMADGSMDAKEAFVNMLKAVADALAQQATQMIATYIAIGIARAFAGMGGGGESSSVDMQAMGVPTAQANTIASGGSIGWSTDMPLNAGVTNPSGFNFAAGGYVSGPTRALVGEGGEGEYLIPESKMRESMARYSRGARGGSVIPESGAGGTSEDGGGVAVAAPIDVRYTVERINSVDYVTADQFQAGMQRAANQGAKQGEQQTLKRLQMSSSTRKRLGM
jgi:hypothetical protein